MPSLFTLAFLSLTTVVTPIPQHLLDGLRKGHGPDLEASGGGSDDPVQGVVRVVQLDRRALIQSGFFRRGLSSRRTPSLSSRPAPPAFLSQGRPGSVGALKTATYPTDNLHPKVVSAAETRRRLGLQMWQRVTEKGEKVRVTLPAALKDSKQTCTAVPFTQSVTSDGCDAATLHNKLCFGQCSSMFIPEDELSGGTSHHQRTSCSRCAPSRVHTVAVPLRCGARGVREKRVMVVEECKCETGREERATVGSMRL
ncbi:DAN domain family member 5 [Periophthalmus magnuspinnatus]|uniref:DAN domain family member 5 n=1 Tax=Periophthalmus magnuspinnatus TaxID=409849 RepID=UPI00145B38BA|nr:DAN domain family member 5 [Periophthalmus magnuspinnatus]